MCRSTDRRSVTLPPESPPHAPTPPRVFNRDSDNDESVQDNLAVTTSNGTSGYYTSDTQASTVELVVRVEVELEVVVKLGACARNEESLGPSRANESFRSTPQPDVEVSLLRFMPSLI